MIQSKNPKSEAIELRKSIGWISPSDFTLKEVAACLGISIKEVKMNGSEGRISRIGENGIISINSNIEYQPSKNFIIAHEIGHFLLHKDLMICSDTSKTLSDWHKKGPQEEEANSFAAELLMPSDQFLEKVKGKKMSFELINDVSHYFNVSKLSAFIKYVSHGDYPVMVIYMEDGFIKWKDHSSDFPFQFLVHNSKIPPLTVAGDYFYHNTFESEPEKIDAIEWFPEDYKIKYQRDFQLWEQCYNISDKGIVSCLWTD